MDGAEFLTHLFADAVSPNRLIAIWCAVDRRAHFFSDPDKAAKCAYDQNKVGREVYFGLGLYRPGVEGRGKAHEVVAITCLWADIDFGPIHKKTGIPPTERDAARLLGRIGLEASIIVQSGHGLHVYWLFKEPLDAKDGAILALRWQATVKATAHALGYVVDPVADLARVLRVPGTVNHKDPEHPVKVEVSENPSTILRYDPDDFDEWCVAEVEPGNQFSVDAVKAAMGPIKRIAPDENYYKRLCKSDKAFKDVWEGTRPFESQSHRDLSLANMGVLAGRTNDEVAAMIYHWRSKEVDPSANPEKAYRQKYIRHTIALARVNQGETGALHALDQIGPVDQTNPDDPKRKAKLAELSKILRVPVAKWEQYGKGVDDAIYILHLTTGQAISVGPMATVRRFGAFADAVMLETGKQPEYHSLKKWHKVLDQFGDIVVRTENPEAGPINRLRGWVEPYLRSTHVYRDTEGPVAEGIKTRHPVIQRGVLWLYRESLEGFIIYQPGGRQVRRGDIWNAFKAAGFSNHEISETIEGEKQRGEYWGDFEGLFTEAEMKGSHGSPGVRFVPAQEAESV